MLKSPFEPCIPSGAKSVPDRPEWIHEIKHMLVSKLRGAREREKAATGKCEGRKSWAEINPELLNQAKRLRRSPKGHQRSLRDVAAELAKLGFVNERGVEFSAASVASMLGA